MIGCEGGWENWCSLGFCVICCSLKELTANETRQLRRRRVVKVYVSLQKYFFLSVQCTQLTYSRFLEYEGVVESRAFVLWMCNNPHADILYVFKYD